MPSLPAIDPQSYQPLREQVYGVLRKAILTGILTPNQQLGEVAIAEELEVSRTPTREAIRMLEQEGLIEIIPRRGAVVVGIRSVKEIEDIFQVRIPLEGLAAALAAQKITESQLKALHEQSGKIKTCIKSQDIEECIEIDTTFHRIIYEASDNDYLQKILDNLFEQKTRFRAASLSQSGRITAALEEHLDITNAIAEKNPSLAQDLAVKHLQSAKNFVIAAFHKDT